ncbi:MAG: hypothetical protein KIT52_13520 [Anaerolineae bacterium]|nr:hypothetical protein [Anaerolineae bacterium]
MPDDPENLVSLAAHERVLDSRLAAVRMKRGLTQESPEYRTIFADYAAIHREYVEMAVDGNEEALKRALFLQWYCVTEPWFLCGLLDLDALAERRLLMLVDTLCASKRLDKELSWMLSYYYLIADYYFQHEGQYPALVAHCQAQPHHDHIEQPIGFVSDRRGQMGDYWKSVFKSSSKKHREQISK